MDSVVTCRSLLTMSTLFEFVPRKNRSCLSSRSCDIVIYIVCEFKSFSPLPSDSKLGSFDSHSCAQPRTFLHLRIETTANMGKHTVSKFTFIALRKWEYLPHSNVLDFAGMSKTPHTYTLLFSTMVSRAHIHMGNLYIVKLHFVNVVCISCVLMYPPQNCWATHLTSPHISLKLILIA